MDTRIVITQNVDPWRNLAMEEYLLNHVRPGESILYLWQNQNTVVIGKNQNAWKECRSELLETEGGKLARRSSGGGAVFHDLGNLNFSFIMDRQLYDVHKQLEVILNALKNLGINAVFSGRNDLTVDDKKFSGNAFSYRSKSALHHGTILVSADIANMTRYLRVSRDKIKSKGIESVRSRVTNLVDYKEDLDIEIMVDAIIHSFSKIYGNFDRLEMGEEGMDIEALNKLYEKYQSWEWRFGESPKFDIEFSTRFPWGNIEIGLGLERGKIVKASVYSDAMDEKFIEKIPGKLQGCLFKPDSMAKTIEELGMDRARLNMSADIADWIRRRGF
ncbi:MAG: lipoate--protein ligase [Clostridiales bacterium]|nr:lipoate--protein ligase [Clostridiales bacterium]